MECPECKDGTKLTRKAAKAEQVFEFRCPECSLEFLCEDSSDAMCPDCEEEVLMEKTEYILDEDTGDWVIKD